uniref:non-specific serine/threonine protein kinase n=1 Tax=Quercus lobata TaxID=97700 RepID=A0A7N2LRT8_QUELO
MIKSESSKSFHWAGKGTKAAPKRGIHGPLVSPIFVDSGPTGDRLKLNWPTKQKICAGIVRSLAPLHEESILKIVHRDIKSANILLDGDFNPKISDFSLGKLYEEENTHINTKISGTM